MSERDSFIALLVSQKPVHGDVIFIMQGDGIYRAAYAAQLYRDGLAPLVAIVGNAFDRTYGSFPSGEVRDEAMRLGMPESAFYFEETGPHTRAEAERAMRLAKEKGWKTILIVTSPHHQYRAFLTFLKAMRDAHLDLVLVNAPAPLPLEEETPWGRRADLVAQEFDRIDLYQKKGDVASFAEGIEYLKSL